MKLTGVRAGRLALVLASCALPLFCHAQKLSFAAGAARSNDPHGEDIGWSVRYAHDIGGPLFATAAYVNEGHVPGHRRDGLAAQVGVRGTVAHAAVVSAAVGAYRYFDTELAESASGFGNSHGWAALYSLAVRWPANAGWFYQLRAERIESHANPDSTLVMASIGVPLDQDRTFGADQAPRGKGGRDEVAGYLGQTIVNSFESPSSTARSIEYRHSFGPVLRASVAWLNEGDARLIRRDGIVAQAWLEPTFDEDLFSLGIGYGGYLAVDAYRPGRHDMGLLSVTASYRLSRSWIGRFTWHRSVSNYDRDSDIFLLGIGYRF